MDEFPLTRRRTLQLGGAVGLGTLAGCLGGDSAAGSRPAYTQYVAPTDDDELTVFYTAWEETGTNSEDSGGNQSQTEDPLFSAATFPFLAVAFLGGFTLGPTGLDVFLGGGFEVTTGGNATVGSESGGNETGDDSAEFETEIDEVFIVGETVVLRGSIDTDEVDGILRNPSRGFFGFVPIRYAPSEETVGDHPLYTAEVAADEVDGEFTVNESDGDDESPVAVGEEEILVGSRETIERILDAKAGERERAAEAFDAVEWLVTTAGSGDSAFLSYGADGLPEEETDESGEENDSTGGPGPGTGGAGGNESGSDDAFTGAVEELSAEPLGVASSTVIDDGENFDDAEKIDAEFAAVFDEELSEDDREVFEAEFGTEAAEVSAEFDGNRVSMTATYTEDSVQG
jgi:hypothetical protein